jgi:hypothetical protein
VRIQGLSIILNETMSSADFLEEQATLRWIAEVEEKRVAVMGA